MLWVYGHYKCFTLSVRGSTLRRQNLIYRISKHAKGLSDVDPHAERVKKFDFTFQFSKHDKFNIPVLSLLIFLVAFASPRVLFQLPSFSV